MSKKIKCPICQGIMNIINDSIKEDNVDFEAMKCSKCGEELVNMNQLKSLTKKYRELRNAKQIKISKWGNSLGLRIPKEIINDLNIQDGNEAFLTKEKNGFKIIIS